VKGTECYIVRIQWVGPTGYPKSLEAWENLMRKRRFRSYSLSATVFMQIALKLVEMFSRVVRIL